MVDMEYLFLIAKNFQNYLLITNIMVERGLLQSVEITIMANGIIQLFGSEIQILKRLLTFT